ncbi:exopolyphosphatase, partial [Vibrio parahaemolyticus]|nr:exopolyphosphatase [Vibrio parahaemolyticus]
TLQGFNREQQLVLATLARFQRKALKLQELPDFNLYKQSDVISLIKILRLSIVLNGQRNEDPLPDITLSIKNDEWILTCTDEAWLENNKLLHADLQEEQERWDSAKWTLTF